MFMNIPRLPFNISLNREVSSIKRRVLIHLNKMELLKERMALFLLFARAPMIQIYVPKLFWGECSSYSGISTK